MPVWGEPRRFSRYHRMTVYRGITGLFCLVLLLSACASPYPISEQPSPTLTLAPTEVPYQNARPVSTHPVPRDFKESTDLSAQVQAGTLPPVARRLPRPPKVVRLVERQGMYGGTWRMAVQPAAATAQFIRTVAYEPLMRWTSDWSGIEPNLVETYSVNSNATVYTFKLRDGLRWSDGEPFTTRDIRFWYEDVLQNPYLTRTIPSWLVTRNSLVRFEFIDDLTFKVRFLAPSGLLLEHLATPDALMITAFPAHYAKKYHQKYLSPAELVRQVKLGGYATWSEMFIRRVGVTPLDLGNFSDPDRPRLTAWLMKNAYQPGVETVTWRRNPYYWKVDPEGNQLPYVDEVVFNIVNHQDDLINLTLAGQVDMQNLSALGLDADEVLQSGQDRGLSGGQYSLFKLLHSENNIMVINLNLTHPDRVKRMIFQNVNFRIGLSYAINRQEILDLLLDGEGKPWQPAPPEGSPFYDSQMATQYTEFNIAEANRYLDMAGYGKDELGHRLGPEGQTISFTIEVSENEPLHIAMLNLISKHLADVGIDMHVRINPQAIFRAIVESNQHDAAASVGGGTFYNDVLLRPSNYIPNNPESFWAVRWANWYIKSSSFDGEVPDETVSIALGMYNRVLQARTPKEQIRLMKSTLTMARENLWTIGIAAVPTRYGIVRENFHNVPAEMPSSWMYPDPAPTNPEQYFIEP